jgi:DNA-binding beta-propeller fold protein YncE
LECGWGGFSHPSDEYVYVVDDGNSVIMKFDKSLSTSSLPSQFGGFGSGPGEFNRPTKAAVDQNGNVYVTDSGNNRIQVFNSSGGYLGELSSKGKYDNPLGITAGVMPPPWSRGLVPPLPPPPYILVVDAGHNRCQYSAYTGDVAGQFGSSGPGDGQFKSPWGVAAGEYIYVVDSGNNRVQAFSWRAEVNLRS